MTPTQKGDHAFAIFEKQARARAALPTKDQEIYYFLKAYWDSLGDRFDADVHEKLALEEAATRFDVTTAAAKDTWARVDGAGLNL
jgi:hypothetical protein